jgi:hypothetical protein
VKPNTTATAAQRNAWAFTAVHVGNPKDFSLGGRMSEE